MNFMENEQPQPPPQPDSVQLQELQAQSDSLHHFLVSILLVLILISGTFWIYLRRQAKTANADLQVIRMQWTNAMVQFQRSAPIMDQMAKKLQEFSRSNPDYAPILAKYIRPGATNAAPGTQAPGVLAPGSKK
jgi:hypothetical protein